mmetsp:Transcript_11095/g.29413  ORF Transcript_11095/g.29413 Transcript_11095/m.29413 type:complete len:231 (+) Transcript_11095:1361-2053(+)
MVRCDVFSAKTWAKFHLRIPMPGDTVSTDPFLPVVVDITEALKPDPQDAAARSAAGATLAPMKLDCVAERAGMRSPPSATGVTMPSGSASLSPSSSGSAAPQSLFKNILMAAARDNSGCRWRNKATRWPRGNVTGVLSNASQKAPSNVAGAAGRSRQKVETRHRSGGGAPAAATVCSSAKRRRSGHSSKKRARKSPFPPPASIERRSPSATPSPLKLGESGLTTTAGSKR